jgi:uncharacterized protein
MFERSLGPRIIDSLRDTPVVYLQGARQCGKTTLARAIAGKLDFPHYLTLDTPAVMASAAADPEGFVAGMTGPCVIDEFQKAPGLPPAIKLAVDRDRRPGRFLLTGSASVLAAPRASESLAGRMELHTLWPLSQGELAGRREQFVDRLFEKPGAGGRPRLPADVPAIEPRDLLARMLAGGFPEPQARKRADRRRAWFDAYVTTILERDVRDLAQIERLADLPRLLKLLASRVAGLINYADLSRSLGIPQTTLHRYLTLLEMTFLVRLLPAWSTNIGKRLTKSPKLLLADTGLLAWLLDAAPSRLAADRTQLGHMLENFVALELIKQLGWSRTAANLFHFRTETGQEVDLVLEDASGRLVGVEVKASSSVEKRDFRGLQALSEIAGKRWAHGIVLYTGADVLPFGKGQFAVPLGQLWA